MGLGRRFKKGDPKPDIRTLPSPEALWRLFNYNSETGELRWRDRSGPKAAGSLAGTVTPLGYIVVGIDRIYYLTHRVIWKMMVGHDPIEFIDHRDGNKSNNRWANLRSASNGQNVQNSKLRRDNRSGAKGVHWDAYHQRWGATISAGRGQVRLGRFTAKKAAIAVRVAAQSHMHGEFSRIALEECVS